MLRLTATFPFTAILALANFAFGPNLSFTTATNSNRTRITISGRCLIPRVLADRRHRSRLVLDNRRAVRGGCLGNSARTRSMFRALGRRLSSRNSLLLAGSRLILCPTLPWLDRHLRLGGVPLRVELLSLPWLLLRRDRARRNVLRWSWSLAWGLGCARKLRSPRERDGGGYGVRLPGLLLLRCGIGRRNGLLLPTDLVRSRLPLHGVTKRTPGLLLLGWCVPLRLLLADSLRLCLRRSLRLTIIPWWEVKARSWRAPGLPLASPILRFRLGWHALRLGRWRS